MNYDNWKLASPPDEPDEKEIPKCACCLEEVEEVFELGITTYGLNSDQMVCDFCKEQLENNLTTIN